MRILLVRHGQSAANVDRTICKTLPDHAVPLSDLGHMQARAAGRFLRNYLTKSGLVGKHIRLWTSPYRRTRQTADALMETAGDVITDRREHILLCEQQFGLFDGHLDEDLPALFPREHAHYALAEAHEGRFWARMPLGESRFDVACRVHQSFGTFHRDAERHGIKTIVVICHGVTLRAFVMQWLHLTPEWFDAEKNPGNCWIRLIEGRGVEGHELADPTTKDRGYLWKGDDDVDA